MMQLHLPGFAPITAAAHYDQDSVGDLFAMAGAGPLAFITYDQLHPPMVDDEAMWESGRWHIGAVQHVIEAARDSELTKGDYILDIGCGIGGPARVLADLFKARVYGVSISRQQVQTARTINKSKWSWRRRVKCVVHDCLQPYPVSGFDVGWSMNMLYHVSSHETMLKNVYAALRAGGKIMIDDWMLTARATADDRALLGHHFVSPYFAVREELIPVIARAGFQIRRITELGHVGRTHLSRHFLPVFEQHYRPILMQHVPEWGAQLAEEFVRSIELTARFYREEKLTYLRIVAEKLSC